MNRVPRKLLYFGGYHLVIPWPESAAFLEIGLCGMKAGGWGKRGK